MATGWAKDGAVQDQIDASVDDAVRRSRSLLPAGPSPGGIAGYNRRGSKDSQRS